MDYLKNHCWCHNSNWDGKGYDCNIIVGLNNYEDHNKEDFLAITTKVSGFNQNTYDMFGKLWADRGISEDEIREQFQSEYSTLKPEVIEWLAENIDDGKGGDKMWCIGDEEYLMTDSGGINIFFQRRKDAMAFIKRWSKWKKPVHYTQYFTDVRKKLNLTTMRYE